MKTRLPYLLAALIAGAAVMNTTTHKGLSAAPSLVLKTTEGEEIDIRKPASKILLVSFWSPGCSICSRDQPTLDRIYQQFDRSSLDILAVAMPYDSASEVDGMVQRTGISYPVAHDLSGKISAAFPAVRFTPTSFLLDSSGTILWRHTGQLNMAELDTTVRLALSNHAKAASLAADSRPDSALLAGR